MKLSMGVMGLVALAAVASITTGAIAAEPLPTVADVSRHLDQMYRSRSSHGTMTMKVVTERFTREMKLEQWSRGEEQGLVVIRAPAREAGNASLRTEEGLWSYAARADRLVRIPSGLLSESWMGSHFTNDDLMRESSYEKDFESVVERVEEDGRSLLRIRMTPRKGTPIVWTRLDFLVTDEPGAWLPVRIDFFDGDRVARVMRYEAVKEIGGRRIPTRLVLAPTDKPKESTTVVYEAMTFDAKVDADVFTPRGLRRAAQR